MDRTGSIIVDTIGRSAELGLTITNAADAGEVTHIHTRPWFAPGCPHSGQEVSTATGVASMMVRGAGVSVSGDGQADFRGTADGLSATRLELRLHSRVLARSDGSVVTLILYRPEPLHVAPPQTPPRGQLRTPNREKPVRGPNASKTPPGMT